MSKPVIPNVLAARYASAAMTGLWSPEHKIVLERQLWVAVLRAQRELGVDIPDGVIDDYQAVIDDVDLESIAAREAVTRHDVKARIEEFSALAGHEHIHKGMTSRDLTENVEQLQVRASLLLVRDKIVATLARLGAAGGRPRRARDHWTQPQRGRAGNHPRQAVRDRRRRTAGRVRPARRPDRALSAARHQGSGRYQLKTCSTCSTATMRKLAELEASGRRAPRVRARADQRRSGLSAIARLRRRERARAAGGRAVIAGDDDSPDGRQRAGHRGLQARPSRLVGHAAQDEHPFVRARQRFRGDPARLRVDGRRVGR